ncbi:MAG TPA: TIR domain-containing protein, partial [Roseiarcus sp.]|nr:TIR domain-containing protein [Roseiarcus sp.]
MAKNEPIAFLSYVRADDEHDHGRITKLRARLEGEVRMHTGKTFKIYQDKRDLKWGEQWKERLDSTLLNVTFLIPVITPSYFQSMPCRREFEQFLMREKQLGENHLILPIYYLETDEIEDTDSKDEIARIVASRSWPDWRNLRFKPVDSPEIELAISEMAHTIKLAMRELESVITASRIAVPRPTPSSGPYKIDVSKFSLDTPTFDQLRAEDTILADENVYYIYTSEFDEIVSAHELSSEDELTRLYRFVSKNNSAIKRLYRRQLVEFGSYLRKRKDNNLSITFLVDNSGSMRGEKILHVSSWLIILSEIFEASDILVEVLGYTTRAWKG